MKKLLTIFLILFCFSGIAQTFPNTPHQANDKTNNIFDGAVTAANGMVIGVFVDTTAANAVTYLKNTPFIQITTQDNNTWIRNSTAVKWIQTNANGSPTSGIDTIFTLKQNCLDIQKYTKNGVTIAYDTILLYDGIIKPGVITQTSTLTFDVTQYIYRLACELTKTPLDTSVTVTAPDDSLLRIDYIGGNALGQVEIIEGTPSNSATPPTYDQNQFLPFSEVFVSQDTVFLIPTSIRYLSRLVADTAAGQITFRDTTHWGPYPLASDNLIIHPGTVLNPFAYAIDTVALQQVRADIWIYVKGSSGISIPKYSMYFDGINGNILQLNADKSVTTGNLVGFPGTSNGTISTGGNPMKLQSTNSTLHLDVQNVGGALAAGGGMLKVSSGGTTGGANSFTLDLLGNSNLPLLYAGSEQNLGVATNTPSATAAMDINGPFGIAFPRMSTTIRDGMTNWVGSVTLTNGGSGYTLAAPSFSVSGVTGKAVRIIPTVVGGIVTALTIDYHGTGVPASGSLVVNNTGTGGTGAAATFTQTTGNTIAQWQTIINTDSSSCPIETWNGSSWIGACGTTGGGGTQGFQDVLTVNSTLSTNNTITNGGNTLSINSTSATAASNVSISGSDLNLTVNGNSGSASTVQANETQSQIGFGISGPTNVLLFNSTGTFFESSLDGKGIQYNTDYSANYTNRSLVDKEYVDTHSGSGTVSSIATGYGLSGGTITTTGTLVLDSATVYTYVRSLIGSGGSGDTLFYNTPYFNLITHAGHIDTLNLSSTILDSIHNPVGFFDQTFNNNRNWDLAGASFFINNSGDGLTYLQINSSGQTTQLGSTDANIITDQAAGTTTINAVNTMVNGQVTAVNPNGTQNTFQTAGHTILGDFDNDNYIDITGSGDGGAIVYHAISSGHNLIGSVQFSTYGAGALVTDGSGNITATSDFRVKHDIEPLTFGINELNKVNPYTFIYNKDTTNTIMPGFIAQNINDAFGGVGIGKDNKGMLTLNTNIILATLVNVVKDQQKQIEELTQQIKLIHK